MTEKKRKSKIEINISIIFMARKVVGITAKSVVLKMS